MVIDVGREHIFDFDLILRQLKENGRYVDESKFEYAYKIRNINHKSALFGDPDFVINQITERYGLTNKLSQILYEWPHLKEPLDNLAHYLTRIFPSNDGIPLLDLCIVEAISQYEKVTNKMHSEKEGLNLPLQVSAFIEGLSRNMGQILGHVMYGYDERVDEWVVMRPMAMPIYNWLDKYSFVELLIVPNPVYSDNDALLARVHVIHNIFPYWTLKGANLNWPEIFKNQRHN